MRRLFRFRILSGLFLLLVLLTVSGCRQQAEPEEDAKPTDGIYTIFYTNTEGTQLVRHKHTAVSENFDGILRELLEAFCTPDGLRPHVLTWQGQKDSNYRKSFFLVL